MVFKFEKLEVWQESLQYHRTHLRDLLAELPGSELYNLQSQLKRAATSINLNIAEGSTGQTDAEHARFIGIGDSLSSTKPSYVCTSSNG